MNKDVDGKMVTSNAQLAGHSTSALLSAFFSKSSMNPTDLTGQRPCPFECLFFAWAVRPTPLQKRVKGMACLWASTSSKYLLALVNGIFLMAWAVSRVFYHVDKKKQYSELKSKIWDREYNPCFFYPLIK